MNKTFSKALGIFQNEKFLLSAYIVIVTVASVHPFFLGDKGGYTHYNNYVIFKQAFYHLIHHQDLYVLYPAEHWDLFKYSPAFALFMGLFAWLPDVAGATLWNLLNALVLYYAIRKLPLENARLKNAMLLFVFIEMLTSIQNYQSNALIAGLIIFAFNFFEAKKIWMASLCIVLTVFIKLFGIVAFALFLFYPEKIKFIISSIVWILLLIFIPVAVSSFSELQMQYESWGRMLAADHSASYGLSVMGWLHRWFGIELSKNIIAFSGAVLFCIPLLRFRLYQEFRFRLLMLASVLLWIVIFNHKAESPTFVIAIAGVALWYYTQERTWVNLVLVVFAFVFTSLSPTDLFPPALRQFVTENILKAVPCILIWFKLQYDLLFTAHKAPVLQKPY